MSDISFNGLGAFALFLFTCFLFAFVIVLLLMRQLFLYKKAHPYTVRSNSLLIVAGLFPFFSSLIGLIIIQFINDPGINWLMDNYLAIGMIVFSLLIAIIWVIMGLKALRKNFSQVGV